MAALQLLPERRRAALVLRDVLGFNTKEVAAILDHRAEIRGAPLELRPTRANGQPAFGCYLRSRAWGFMVLPLSDEQIAAITVFSDPSLIGRFGQARQI